MSGADPTPGRLWEVDAARTLAILMMVAYHAAYDVHELAPGVDLDPFSGGWQALQVATGSSFLFVVGVSLAISNGRGRARGLAGFALYRRHVRRAARVAAAALVVSAVTWVALGGDDWVRFGILHCIAAGMLIGPLLVRLGWGNALLAPVVLVVGLMLKAGPTSQIPGLLVLGVRPAGGAGVDWYPIAPWLAAMLIGLAVGLALYPGGRRGPWGRRLPRPRAAAALGAPGRHALPIYLLHQPVLILIVAGVLMAVGVEVSWARFT